MLLSKTWSCFQLFPSFLFLLLQISGQLSENFKNTLKHQISATFSTLHSPLPPFTQKHSCSPYFSDWNIYLHNHKTFPDWRTIILEHVFTLNKETMFYLTREPMARIILPRARQKRREWALCVRVSVSSPTYRRD